MPSDEAAARGGGVGSTDSARAEPVERVDWFLLDWDDLALGDPALDYSALFWPLAPDDDPAFWHNLPLPAMGEAARGAFDERLALYVRARLLDGVIDVLADYVEGGGAGARGDRPGGEARGAPGVA